MIFSVNQKYTCVVLNIIRSEDKEFYRISCRNQISRVEKYPNQSYTKDSIDCIYIGRSLDGAKHLFIQDMNDVLSETYSINSDYPFTVFSQSTTPLTHRVFLYLLDQYGFKHIVETLDSTNYTQGQIIRCRVKNIENSQLSLEIISSTSDNEEEAKIKRNFVPIDFASFKENKDNSLRPYQEENKLKIYEAWQNQKSVMLQMPTGTGKTILFVSIVKDLITYGIEHDSRVRVLILAHRKELIEQISHNLSSKYGLIHGIILSQNREHKGYSVQVGSVPTLSRRLDKWEDTEFDVIIIDEAHHVKASSYKKILDAYPNSKVLGVTATPYRLNGSGFRPEFQKLITSPSVKEFIQMGFLSEYDYYSIKPGSSLQAQINKLPVDFDGDYVESSMLKIMNSDSIKAGIVKTYMRFAQGKKGIVYTINRAHNVEVCQKFCDAGIRAVAIDSTTAMDIRLKYVKKFRCGEIDIICNVNIFSEGFDCPDLEFIQLARPTKSLSLYLQQVGRGFRPSEGKEKLIILDNVGLYNKFGFPSAIRDWNQYFEGFHNNQFDFKLQHSDFSREENRRIHDIEEGDEVVELLHTSTSNCDHDDVIDSTLAENVDPKEQNVVQGSQDSNSDNTLEDLKQIIAICKNNGIVVTDEIKSNYSKLLHDTFDQVVRDAIIRHYPKYLFENNVSFIYEQGHLNIKNIESIPQVKGNLSEIEHLITLLKTNNFSIPTEVIQKQQTLLAQENLKYQMNDFRAWLESYIIDFNSSAKKDFFMLERIRYDSSSSITMFYTDLEKNELDNTCEIQEKTFSDTNNHLPEVKEYCKNTILSVQIDELHKIQESTSIGTFAKTIKYIGWKRIEALKIKVFNKPFIFFSDLPRKDCRLYELAPGWYFRKVLSNDIKSEILKEIFSKLNLPYIVRLIDVGNQ